MSAAVRPVEPSSGGTVMARGCHTLVTRLASQCGMVPSAPRYQERLLSAIRRLDDDSLSVAEVCRRVGAYAESHGMTRPSYVHVRRIIVSERARARELAEIRNEMLKVLVSPMPPDLDRSVPDASGCCCQRSVSPGPRGTRSLSGTRDFMALSHLGLPASTGRQRRS